MANPCIITFKGKDYSIPEFEAMLHDGMLDTLVSDGIIDTSKFKADEQIQRITESLEGLKIKADVENANDKNYSDQVESMSKSEFVEKLSDKFESKAEAERYWKDTRDAILQKKIDTTTNELGDDLRDIRGEMSLNPIGSVKVWSKVAKLMGLYFEKGITKVEDFAKATGIKATQIIKDLWNSVTGRRKSSALSASRKVPMDTLNARLYYEAAIRNINTTGDPQSVVDSVKNMIDVLDIIAIHANQRDSHNVQAAKEAIKDLYQELSVDLSKVNSRIAEEVARGQRLFDLGDDLSLKDQALLRIEDDFLWQKRAQEAIERNKGKLDDDMNPYMQRDISVGRVRAKIDRMYKEIFGKQYGQVGTSLGKGNSLLERMKKDGIHQNQLDLFLYAQHAKERNARVREINRIQNESKVKELQDKIASYGATPTPSQQAQITKWQGKINEIQSKPIPQEGSGMSDIKADEILNEFTQSGKYNKLDAYAKEFRESVIKPAINMYEEAGILTPEQAEMFRNGESPETGVKFDYYIPLKVNDGMISDAGGSSGPTMSSPVKKITGTDKYDYAKRNSPFAQSILDYKAAAKLAEDNKVKQSLYKLVENNPNDAVWEIVSPTYAPSADGYVAETTPDQVRQNSAMVMVDGKKKYILFHNKGLRDAWNVASSNNNVSGFIKAMGKVFKAFRMVTNIKRGILTQFNPVFGATNLTRDIQDAIFNSSGLNIPMSGAKIVKQIPKTMRSLVQASLGNLNPSSREGQLIDEYLDAGGKVSWIDYDKIENEMKEIKRLSYSFNKTGLADVPKRMVNAILGTISAVNESIELATRVATYKFLRESGYSKDKSAAISKNMTVNFNKKGTLTPITNVMYLFSNAGIQANITGVRNVIRSKKAQRYAAGAMLLGFAVPFIQEYLIENMSDNEEDKKRYRKLISDEEYANQLILPIGGGHMIRVPKSYGVVRGFFNIGEEFGRFYQDGDAMRHAGNAMGNITSIIDPIGGNTPNPYSAYTPTAFKPFMEIPMNRKWNNSPIYPNQGFGIPKPDSEMFFDNVNPQFRDFTKMLYDKSYGKVDVSPETIEYLFEDFSGGIIKEIKNATEQSMKAFDGKPIEKNKIPLYGRFLTDISKDQWRYSSKFYDLYNDGAKRKFTNQDLKDLEYYGKKSGMDEKKLQKKLREIEREQEKLTND